MAGRSLPGSAPRLPTRRATTSAGAGTTPAWRHSTATRSSTRAPARTRRTWSGASTSCACHSPASGISGGRSTCCKLWRDTLDQPDPGDLSGKVARALSVPFVDYARGDGWTVGPGCDHEWTPIIIGDSDTWVDGYRGLWGLDTGDRFAGERAPAGPKYTRTGTVRQSWADPLGFSGLAKVPPPSRAPAVLDARIAELRRERDDVRREAEVIAAALPGLSEEVASLRGAAGLDQYAAGHPAAMRAEEASSPRYGRRTSS